ncbi:hypothetical protein FSP39_015061 [Pinctada imbricata]|uniref:Uncharacterized protein n=1 Tax=Pinctada imbricata TaxID=66713 RepID=A0AA89CA28_PINIB|nr:hypothetical protein FSP39_015061 [Pinctada imbricata]
MFSQVDVLIQGRTVTSANGHYPYKAIIQTLLGYGEDAKSSQLTLQMWEKDTPGHMDDNDVNGGQNNGLYKRAESFAESKTVEMIGPIANDIFKIDKYILNQVGISVKFYKSKPQFCLMTNELGPDYDVVIEDMALQICKVQINPAVIYAHAQTLQHANAKYPYIKTEVKMMTLAQGQVNFTWDNVFQGMSPNKVVIGFVDSKAVAGSYDKNPFFFQNYNLNQITVFVNGIPTQGRPIKVMYDSSKGYMSSSVLLSLFQSAGKWMRDCGNQITRDDIGQGYALYAFNLEPAFENGNYLTLIKQGNVRIDVQFGSSIPHPVTCIVYSEGLGYFEINLARDILLE